MLCKINKSTNNLVVKQPGTLSKLWYIVSLNDFFSGSVKL